MMFDISKHNFMFLKEVSMLKHNLDLLFWHVLGKKTQLSI